jgi:hypothetical protein
MINEFLYGEGEIRAKGSLPSHHDQIHELEVSEKNIENFQKISAFICLTTIDVDWQPIIYTYFSVSSSSFTMKNFFRKPHSLFLKCHVSMF